MFALYENMSNAKTFNEYTSVTVGPVVISADFFKSRPYPLTVCFDWAEPLLGGLRLESLEVIHRALPTTARARVAVKSNGVAFQRCASAHGFG